MKLLTNNVNDNNRRTVSQVKADQNVRHAIAMSLLDSIHTECGINQDGRWAAAVERMELTADQQDAGLQTEINTSRTLVNTADTIRGMMEVLTRHPFGFRGDGSRDANGKLRGGFEPFTPEEDAAGQIWADGAKLGREWATTGKLSTDTVWLDK
jgi:hypothetical protein